MLASYIFSLIAFSIHFICRLRCSRSSHEMEPRRDGSQFRSRIPRKPICGIEYLFLLALYLHKLQNEHILNICRRYFTRSQYVHVPSKIEWLVSNHSLLIIHTSLKYIRARRYQSPAPIKPILLLNSIVINSSRVQC